MQHEIGTHLRMLPGLALATIARPATPALAQSISAQTTKIIELNRAGKFSRGAELAQNTLADAEKAPMVRCTATSRWR
jgi:hypothetical protein